MSIWFTSLVLVTLGQRLGRKPRPFSVTELLAWAPDLKRAQTAHVACNLLARTGMLEAAPAPADNPRANQNPQRPALWQLTTVGKEAARAAQMEAASHKRSETATAVNTARNETSSLPNRLWTVFRARRVLTTLEAADVLGDAGDNLQALRKSIGMYLSSWHALLPDVIQVSERRVGKCHRYVLIGDVGRFPPEALRNPEARARGKKLEAAA